MSPQYQRWSWSMLVTIAASSPSRRNVPSLSSASTMSHSPESSPAFVPTSLSSLPTRKLGCRSAARMISVIIDVVVVLPCVPGDPEPAPRARRCRRAHRPGTAPGCPACLGRAHLDVRARHRGADHDGIGVRRDVLGDLRDEALDAEQPQPVEARVLVQVRAAHAVAHLGEDRRVRAHARAADADDVDAPRLGEVEHGTGLRRGHGRSPPPGRRAGPRRPGRASARAASDIAVSRAGSEQQLAGDRVEARAVGLRVGQRAPRRRPASMTRALSVWWSPAAPGHGTSTDGTPAAASSATVTAPARHTASDAVPVEAVHVVLVGDELVDERVLRPAQPLEPGLGSRRSGACPRRGGPRRRRARASGRRGRAPRR